MPQGAYAAGSTTVLSISQLPRLGATASGRSPRSRLGALGVVHRLGSYARQHSVHQALNEIGRVERTVHILHTIDNEEYRRRQDSTSAIMRPVAESDGELEPDFGGVARAPVAQKSGCATVPGGAP